MSTTTPQIPDWMSNTVKDDLVTILCLLESEIEVKEFLEALLTDREFFLIACRLRAVNLLYEGLSTVDGRTLSRHAPNISRGVFSRANSRIVKSKKTDLYRSFYERLKAYRLGIGR